MADPVHIEGLRDFQRTLKRVEPEVEKELRAELRAVAKRLAAEASAHALRKTGKYARSIRPRVTAKGVSVGSNLPQAGVLHWGGTIKPRGVPITFAARPVISEAVDRHTDQILEDVGKAIEQAAHRAGWHD